MTFFRAFAAIALVVLAIALGGAVFQVGYQAGAAASGVAVPAVVGPGYGYGWGWGFGGGLFHVLGFLFFLFLFFAILRAAFGGWGRGRGSWGHGGPGYGRHDGWRGSRWEERAREVHDDWHRREAGTTTPTGSGTPSGPSGSGPAGSAPSSGDA